MRDDGLRLSEAIVNYTAVVLRLSNTALESAINYWLISITLWPKLANQVLNEYLQTVDSVTNTLTATVYLLDMCIVYMREHVSTVNVMQLIACDYGIVNKPLVYKLYIESRHCIIYCSV